MPLHPTGLRCLTRWARRGSSVPGTARIRPGGHQSLSHSPDLVGAALLFFSRTEPITGAASHVQSSQNAASNGESTCTSNTYMYYESENEYHNIADDAHEYISTVWLGFVNLPWTRLAIDTTQKFFSSLPFTFCRARPPRSPPRPQQLPRAV